MAYLPKTFPENGASSFGIEVEREHGRRSVRLRAQRAADANIGSVAPWTSVHLLEPVARREDRPSVGDMRDRAARSAPALQAVVEIEEERPRRRPLR